MSRQPLDKQSVCEMTIGNFLIEHNMKVIKWHRLAFAHHAEDLTLQIVAMLRRDGFVLINDLIRVSIAFLQRNYGIANSAENPFWNSFIYPTSIEKALATYGVYFLFSPSDPTQNLTDVRSVGLDEHVVTRLLSNRLLSLEEISTMSKDEISALRNIGPKTINEIMAALDQYDLRLLSSKIPVS